VHEYSVADSTYAKAVWTAVCWAIVIPLGRRVTGDASLYRYLWRSVLAFDGLTRLTGRMTRAGLEHVHVEPMDGWQRGIVHTIVGHRRRRTS
jgi:ubiquinone/menaquinone biosynthesis C-methylase UbiE